MGVYHVLKDGSRPKDIRGHVVKLADADPLYRALHSINRKTNTSKITTYQALRTEDRRLAQ